MARRLWNPEQQRQIWEQWLARPDKYEKVPRFAKRIAPEYKATADSIDALVRRMEQRGGPDSELAKDENLCAFDLNVLSILQRKEKRHTFESLCSAVDRGPETVRAALDRLQAASYNVVLDESAQDAILVRTVRPSYKTHTHEWYGRAIRFAQIADTHVGSSVARLDFLHEFYGICKREGITDVYHAGDVVAGNKVYSGQEFELAPGCVGYDSQLEFFAAHYPKIKGITTHFIAGNHDLSFQKAIGANPGLKIVSLRPDFDYLGDIEADVILGKDRGIRHRLFHAKGGKAYADDYKAKKIIEGLPGGTKPNTMAFGHWHVMLYAYGRNIHYVLGGTFEGQSSLFRAKGWYPALGGWLIEANISPHGGINRFKADFITFYWEQQ